MIDAFFQINVYILYIVHKNKKYKLLLQIKWVCHIHKIEGILNRCEKLCSNKLSVLLYSA